MANGMCIVLNKHNISARKVVLYLIEALEGGGVQAADPCVARAAWLGARLAGGG